MTNFEYLTEQANRCIELSRKYLKEGDLNMCAFFNNAKSGFLKKRNRLSVKECGEPYELHSVGN